MPNSSAAASAQAPARLLLVDDEEAVLKLVKSMLERAQYHVVSCGSGIEALQLMQDGHFDCVITDAIMPNMSGYDLVKTVRHHPDYGKVPILMLTRKRHRQDVKKAVEVGVTDYVLKPIDEALLLDKVELCVRKGAGKRHIFECTLSGDETPASISLPCKILSISESDITLLLSFNVHPSASFDLQSALFDKIGIKMPLLKLIQCEPATEGFGQPEPGVPGYRAKFSFVGLAEAELRKIRAWLQKEEIRRRK